MLRYHPVSSLQLAALDIVHQYGKASYLADLRPPATPTSPPPPPPSGFGQYDFTDPNQSGELFTI